MAKNQTFKVARIHDPAFAAASREEVVKYARTRELEDMPVVAAGLPQPLLFHCRRLTRSEMIDSVGRFEEEERKWAAAFCLGVVRISGGRFGEGWEPAGARAKDRHAMTDEELDHAQIAPADMRDIGQVIYARSDVPFDCAPLFQLLPSSLAAWSGNARRYAEQTSAAARQSSEQPKGE